MSGRLGGESENGNKEEGPSREVSDSYKGNIKKQPQNQISAVENDSGV